MATASKRAVMTLYSSPRCPYCHRVRMVLKEKGIPAEVLELDAQNPGPELLELNPYGTVPTLADRDLTLYESRIIMEYLDERFPHPPLMPIDPVGRANIRLFLYRVDRDWFSRLETIAGGGKSAAKARKELQESLLGAARLFAAKPFFLNDEITLVDCAIAPLLWRLPRLGVEIPSQAKSIHDYARRIFARPGFRASLSDLEKEMREYP